MGILPACADSVRKGRRRSGAILAICVPGPLEYLLHKWSPGRREPVQTRLAPTRRERRERPAKTVAAWE